jgi:outer membrane beta-barrel protein
MSRLPLVLGLTAMVGLAAAGVRAEDEPPLEQESAYGAIQKRLYEVDHELSLGWAYLPLNPYYKGYGASLSYTIHFNHLLALELFRVGWAWNVDTSLKTKLIDQLPDISPAEFPAVVFYENTNLLLKLLYGKQSLFNRVVLHWEIFATAGVAFVYRNPFNVDALDMDNNRIDFGVNGGFGFRFWLDPTWSLRVDLRDTVLLLGLNRADLPLRNSAEIGLSIAVNL